MVALGGRALLPRGGGDASSLSRWGKQQHPPFSHSSFAIVNLHGGGTHAAVIERHLCLEKCCGMLIAVQWRRRT